MSNLLQTTVQKQTAMPVFTTIAYAWGEEDGMAGKSEFCGYDYFVGANLADYFAGHAAGKAVLESLKATVLNEVRQVLQGDPMVAQWQAEGSPMSGATWDGDYSDVYGSGDYDN
jgi:hypothetical protein